MDNIKEAFQNVKRDIFSLRQELDYLNTNILGLKNNHLELTFIIKDMIKELENLKQNHLDMIKNQKLPTTTQEFKNTTKEAFNPTDNTIFKPLNNQKQLISTGNEGVPTDRQTDQQTDQQTEKHLKTEPNSIHTALEILNSLDNLKKEIRLKFKRLTDQEFLVFSTIYQLDEEQKNIDYKILSESLNLSESSIREYVGKLIKKGIPVDKHKINNKSVLISISPNLKKITTLSTILQLREI